LFNIPKFNHLLIQTKLKSKLKIKSKLNLKSKDMLLNNNQRVKTLKIILIITQLMRIQSIKVKIISSSQIRKLNKLLNYRNLLINNPLQNFQFRGKNHLQKSNRIP